jgi:hypothetical protein
MLSGPPSPVVPTVDFDAPGVQHGFLRLPWSRDESAWGNLMIPITVFCTNFRGTRLAESLEAELGIPIYDTVATGVWAGLRLARVDPRRVTGWGSVFTLA